MLLVGRQEGEDVLQHLLGELAHAAHARLHLLRLHGHRAAVLAVCAAGHHAVCGSERNHTRDISVAKSTVFPWKRLLNAIY